MKRITFITINGGDDSVPYQYEEGKITLLDAAYTVEQEGFGHELDKAIQVLERCLNSGYPACYVGTNFDAYIETGE